MRGREEAAVVSVNISGGGIPKRPIEVARVMHAGIVGDAHNHDKHNTPLQAISLLDLEDIEALRTEGFDLFPGATGENVTVRGLDVDALEVGNRLRLTGGVEIELTKRRRPCYVLDAIDPRLRSAIDGRLGFYARVLVQGELRAGEEIEVMRAPACHLSGRPMGGCTGAILAGGRGSRMGAPKHQVSFPDQTTMVDRIALALRDVCDQVVVVGGRVRSLRCVPDLQPEQGPLGGVEALLASGLAERYLVLPCDVPLVTSELLARLRDHAPAQPAAVFQIEREADFDPLPARIASSALPTVRELLAGDRRSMHALMTRIDAAKLTITRQDAQQLLNVNTRSDLAEAQRLLARAPRTRPAHA